MPAPWYRRIDPWHAAPIVLAALFAIVYLIWQPRTVDLAAHTFRADLFGEEGFTIWNGQWYGGHHTPAYSILSPPLAWLLAPPLALAAGRGGVRGAVRAARARLVRRRAGALGLDLVRRGHRHAAVHQPAAVRDRRGVRARGAARAPAPPLLAGDPVRGPLPAGQPGGRALPRDGGRRLRDRRAPRPRQALEGLAIAAAAFIPPVFLSWAFPEGGWAPFPTSAYVPIPLFALACLIVLPRAQSALRWGAVLYGLGATLALADRDADGRQRRPPRRAVRRPGAAVRALGPAVDAAALGAAAAGGRLRRARVLAVVAAPCAT